jgi:hypothetical protein
MNTISGSNKHEGLVDNSGKPITARTWDSGNIDGYSYQALVFPEPSDYGINNGNISKLSIKGPNGKLVVSYDRGWDIEPAGKAAKAILDKVLARYAVEQSSETKCNAHENEQETLDSSIKDWYTVEYDTDELGPKIQGTFRGVIQTLLDGGDVYNYIHVDDSIVRERVLEKLSDILDVGYGDLYQLWLKGTASRQLLAKLRRIGFFKESNPESKCNEAFTVYRGGPGYSSSFMIDCGSPERAKALADAISEEAYGHPAGSAKDDAGRHFLGGEIIQFWPVDRYFTATVDPCDKAIEWCQEFLKTLDGEISALTGNADGLESIKNEGAGDILAKHAGDYWYHRYYNSMRRLNLHYKLNGKKQPILRVGGIDVVHVARVLGDALAQVHPELKAGAKKMDKLIDAYCRDHSDENARKFFLNMVKELVPQAFPGIEVLDVTSAWNKDPDGES